MKLCDISVYLLYALLLFSLCNDSNIFTVLIDILIIVTTELA